jgi:hypothetical protein
VTKAVGCANGKSVAATLSHHYTFRFRHRFVKIANTTNLANITDTTKAS